MTAETRVNHILRFFNFPDAVIERVCNSYNGVTRHYHNTRHILNMLEYADKHSDNLSDEDKNCLFLAIIFHDVVYNTRSKTNEEDSITFFSECIGPFKAYIPAPAWDLWMEREAKITHMILATKGHDYSEALPEYVKIIIRADLDGFNAPFEIFWEDTKKILKEYSWLDWAKFKRGRLKFLKAYKEKIKFLGDKAVENLEASYNTLLVWQPRIAVYPGSFNPLHKGHLRILQKAEQIFDKVIVARGNNPSKASVKKDELPSYLLENYQVDTYECLLTSYLQTKEYPITVIRGLRSGMDLHAEITQYRYFQDMMPDIQLVNIFTDTDVEHISSSGIKALLPYMTKTGYELE